MQYTLYIGIIFLLIAGYAIVVAAKRTKKGMHLYHDCKNRYEELFNQGVGNRESLIKICKERYPNLSDEVHTKMVNKCQNVWQLSNLFSVVLDNPRPKSWGSSGQLSDQEAIALIDSTIIDERGRVNTDYKMAMNKIRKSNLK